MYYFCPMFKKAIIFFFTGFITVQLCVAQQFFFRTSDLFQRDSDNSEAGELNIYQDRSMDTLLSRYVYAHKLLGGMQGFRIQIFRSGTRNARAEADKVRIEFISEFPDIPSELRYMEPGYFLVRVGNYRTMLESTKYLYMIRRKYPDAYVVPCVIDYPDLNTK